MIRLLPTVRKAGTGASGGRSDGLMLAIHSFIIITSSEKLDISGPPEMSTTKVNTGAD